MTIHLYGIPNCDTVRKARKWLAEQVLDYIFHDFKKEGVDVADLERWSDECGWQTLLNRRGTTFRKLPEDQKADIDRDAALAIMAMHTSTIKRPVLETDARSEHGGARVLIGFSESEWENMLC